MLYKTTFAQLNNHGYWNHPRYIGCIAHWPANEGGGLTAYDASGYKNDGTLTGGATWTGGQFGSAFKLDGTSDYVNVGTLGTFATTTLDIGTVSLWCRTSSTAVMHLFGNLNTGSGNTRTFFRTVINFAPTTGANDLGKLQCQVRDNNGSGTVGGINTNSGISDGAWHHFLYIYRKAAGTMAIYIDAVPRTITYLAQGTGTTFSNFTQGLTIGAMNNAGTPGEFFSGEIDEFRLYNRELTIPEIAGLYNDPFAEFRVPVRKWFSRSMLHPSSLGLMGVGR